MKKITALSILAVMCVALSACSANNGDTTESSAASGKASETSAEKTTGKTEISNTIVTSENASSSETVQLTNVSLDLNDMFTTRDYEIGYSDCTEITLSDSGSSVTGNGASVSGNIITITGKGTYLVNGTISDGQIVIDAGDEKVQIVLENASVTCSGSAALYVKSADKVFVTTASGSSNKLASVGEFSQDGDNKIDGAVFSKSDITFNGSGSLDISSDTAHGIVCKDDLKITGGTYVIAAAKKGIDCNESMRVASGNITITSGTDGIHAENSDDAAKAFVYIGGGNITITSGGDAIDASGEIVAEDGTVTVKSDGGAANAPAHTNNDFGMRWDRDTFTNSDGSTSSSAKGIKSDSLIAISGGTFVIDSSDDAFHSNDAVIISGGNITASTGDDGIHSDNSVIISDGSVNITTSYEGIEGEIIEISGGDVKVKASDDGMNASGGSTENSGGFGGGFMDTDANAKLVISGGNIVVNADGDGLDSNGHLTVSGGTTFVSGPTNAGNGALDSGISATITGGYIIAAGATGMAENFGSDSTQGSILYTFDQTLSAGTEISLLDASGNVLISFAPEKTYQCAVISTPEVASGNTYTVKAGDKSYTVEMTSNTYGESSGFGNFGGFGGFGGRNDDRRDSNNNASQSADDCQMPQMPSDGQMPQMPSDGQMPQMPNDGQMPQMPNDGQMPQMPSDGQIPQMPNDGQMPQMPNNGQMPQMPNDGQMPQMPNDGQKPNGRFGNRNGNSDKEQKISNAEGTQI